MMNRLLSRLEALEARDDGGFLIYTHEREEADGSLTLLSDRTFSGELAEVGRVPAAEVERHRRTVIRLNRAYGGRQ